MKGFDDYDNVKLVKDLQPGGYICKIIDAETTVEPGKFGTLAGQFCQHLTIYIDIAEGECKDYYTDLFYGMTDKKLWKGKLNFYFPTEWDEPAKRKLKKNVISPIEQSNPGFKWCFNEQDLRDKFVGVLFYEREWEWEEKGINGFTVTPYELVPIEEIRNKTYKIKKSQPKQEENQPIQLPKNLPF